MTSNINSFDTVDIDRVVKFVRASVVGASCLPTHVNSVDYSGSVYVR